MTTSLQGPFQLQCAISHALPSSTFGETASMDPYLNSAGCHGSGGVHAAVTALYLPHVDSSACGSCVCCVARQSAVPQWQQVSRRLPSNVIFERDCPPVRNAPTHLIVSVVRCLPTPFASLLQGAVVRDVAAVSSTSPTTRCREPSQVECICVSWEGRRFLGSFWSPLHCVVCVGACRRDQPPDESHVRRAMSRSRIVVES
jgi:hypothetical protein